MQQSKIDDQGRHEKMRHRREGRNEGKREREKEEEDKAGKKKEIHKYYKNSLFDVNSLLYAGGFPRLIQMIDP